MKRRNLFTSVSLAFFIVILLLAKPVFSNEHNKNEPLRVIFTESTLLWDFGIINDDGQLLVWTSKIKGHIAGYMAWWFDLPFQEPLIHEDFIVSFYSSRWEIYDSDPFPSDGAGGVTPNPDAKLLLAGLSAGETLYATDPVDSDGNWDGDGKVTETNQKFKKWKGCVMHESGPVLVSSPTGAPGKIRIYPKGFRPRDLLKPSAETSDDITIQNELKVLNNYPNPFNPSTTIEFRLAESTEVRIDIYNIMGQKVETLVNKEMQAGNHKFKWNASEMASGIYYYKVQANGLHDVKRMILIK